MEVRFESKATEISFEVKDQPGQKQGENGSGRKQWVRSSLDGMSRRLDRQSSSLSQECRFNLVFWGGAS